MYHKWTRKEDDLIREAYSKLPIVFHPELLASVNEDACKVRAKMLRIRQYRFHAVLCSKDISDIDLSYIAGFVDGEGSIYLREQGDKYFLSISNSDYGVIEWMQKVLQCGKIETRKANIRYTKKHYMLRIARIADVIYLLKRLSPFLHIKTELAKRAISYNLQTLNRRQNGHSTGGTEN